MSQLIAFATEIALVLPAYNEEQTVAKTIEDFHRYLPDAEFIIVNNNSSDRTRAVAEEAMQRLGCRGSVIDEPRQGKGNAVRRAFHDVDARIYVLADADQTYPAENVNKLIEEVREGRADMVVGDRRSGGHYSRENKRAFHGFGNALVQTLVNRLFRAKLVDIMSGYRVFSHEFVKSYAILVEGFQIETDVTLHALHRRFRIVEIPIDYRDRPDGSVSKLNTFSDGAKVVFTIAQILRYYRPLAFFSTASLLALLAGLAAGTPVLMDWARYRYIYHVPLAILASGLVLVSTISMAVGLILDAIAHQDRASFERRLLALRRR